MTQEFPRILEVGEDGLLVEFEPEISPPVNRRVRQLTHAIEQARLQGVVEVVPAYRSLMIYFDRGVVPASALARHARGIAANVDTIELSAPRLFRVPTVYGGEHGSDLEAVAAAAGISAGETVALFSSQRYPVYCLGFQCCLPYLGDVPGPLHLPRLATPRTHVAAGSVGVAGGQAVILPMDQPSGFHYLGRTFVTLYDPSKNPPTAIRPGDRIECFAVDEPEARRWQGAPIDACLADSTQTHVARTDARPHGSLSSTHHRTFLVHKPGPFTTLQDAGRPGLRHFGIPISGAMDQFAYGRANWLVGNDPGEAVLEILLHGLHLEALDEALVAITGADLDARWNDRPAPLWRSFLMHRGDRLAFKQRRSGARACLAVAGGFAGPRWFGSRSTFVKGGMGAPLGTGDVLERHASPALVEFREVAATDQPALAQPRTLRVLPGPQADHFTSKGRETFLSATYRISPKSDRQGFRTEGPPVEIAKGPGIISDPTPLGAIQIPGDGRPIILHRDGQSTGGYAKIATVVTVDLDWLGRMMPGDTIRFEPVTDDFRPRVLK